MTDRGPDPAQLREYVAAGRAAHPEFPIDDADFTAYVAARARDGAPPPAAHAGDLLLGYACARGLPTALETFHRLYAGVIARVLGRRSATQDTANDVTQIVHERLLVAAPGKTPRIADYKGAGPLRSWISTTAATTLQELRRASGRRSDKHADAALHQDLPAELDPEIAYLKERYRGDIETAIGAAWTAMADGERALLRLYYHERIKIDRLGVMYQINRATAARRVAAARDALADGIREQIRDRLHLTPTQYASIIALVRSDLEVSILKHCEPAESR